MHVARSTVHPAARPGAGYLRNTYEAMRSVMMSRPRSKASARRWAITQTRSSI